MIFRTSAIGLAVIVIANAFALGNAAYNRLGEPERTLLLSEREVRVDNAYPHTENSGVSLRLKWCVGDSSSMAAGVGTSMYSDGNCYGRTPDWLTVGRLRAMGFDTTFDASDPEARQRFSRQLARPVFLVLELGGSWQQRGIDAAVGALAEREAFAAQRPDSAALKREVMSLRRRVDWMDHSATRLYLIDAGADVDALRAKYSDRTRYAILRGTVRAVQRRWSSDSAWLGGQIELVSGETVNVSAEDQRWLTRRTFRVTLGIGKRLEPWIIFVQ
jgi:hypothetical protein